MVKRMLALLGHIFRKHNTPDPWYGRYFYIHWGIFTSLLSCSYIKMIISFCFSIFRTCICLKKHSELVKTNRGNTHKMQYSRPMIWVASRVFVHHYFHALTLKWLSASVFPFLEHAFALRSTLNWSKRIEATLIWYAICNTPDPWYDYQVFPFQASRVFKNYIIQTHTMVIQGYLHVF